MTSEYVILSTLLNGQRNLKVIAISSVKGLHFNGSLNRQVFEACKKSEQRFSKITKANVGQIIREDEPGFEWDYLDEYDGFHADTVKEIEGHCKTLVDSHSKDALIRGLDGIVMDAEEYETAKEVLTDAERVLAGTADDIGMPGLTWSEMEERDKNEKRYEKLDFGDPFWNKTFFRHCGGHKGQMTTLFGDSKHGKSSGAMMFSRLLIENGYNGLYTSFEDKDKKYADHVRAGLQDKSKIDNFIVTDHGQGCSTLEDIVATTKYHKVKNDISFLVVDNAQIVDVDGVDFWDEKKKLVTISPRLTKLAIELDIWVLLLSQISNERSKRSGYDRQPRIHDIYGSGQLRKDSYMGISIFKPSEVDDLVVKNHFNGSVRGVKHPNGNDEIWPLSTVLMRQEIVREGEKYWKSVILNFHDEGLFRPNQRTKQQQEQDVPF